MADENLRDLNAFVAVAAEGSFTRAAARLGVSQSALSQTVRNLEERLGIRLLNRTTRSVSPTEAGDRLLAQVTPALAQITAGLDQVLNMRDDPSGSLRLSADEFAIENFLWPKLEPFLTRYPEISIELVTDYARSDIVGERFDAGVRRGNLVAKDMVSMRIGPDIPMAVVAAPATLTDRTQPRTPQDLAEHNCINLRLPTHGELFSWTFTSDGQDQRVKTTGRLVFTTLHQVRAACLAGFGLAYLPRAYVASELKEGRLSEVLSDWQKTFEGYHLYYSNRRRHAPALAALIKALRFRDPAS